MYGDQSLVAFESRSVLNQHPGIVQDLLRGDRIIGSVAECEVLIGTASDLTVQFLHGLHFHLCGLRRTTNAHHEVAVGLRWILDVVDSSAYRSS